jgi:molecular chaperone GrpE (heat shock protein)
MPEKPMESAASVTAADIERSIQALNKMAERLWGQGREIEAKVLLEALDSLNRALDRIRIGENSWVVTLH